jgi:hypothetical protein
VPTAGTWRTDRWPDRHGCYLLRTSVVAEQPGTAVLVASRATVRRVFLHGAEVVSPQTPSRHRLVAVPVVLRAGANPLLVVATTVGAPPAERAGAFLRITGTAGGPPLETIRYVPPAAPPGAAGPPGVAAATSPRPGSDPSPARP